MRTDQLNDKWFRFLGVPVIGLMGHIIFFNRNDTGPERFGFLTIYMLSMLETVLLWEVNRLIVIYFRKKYVGLKHTAKRIVHTLVVCILFTIVLRTVNIYLYDRSFFWGYRFPLEGYLHSIFVAILFVVIIAGIYEGIYYFRMWKNTAVEAEALRAENLQTELDLLKVQLDPHFLFNSLGSLSSLIDEDTSRAKAFLEQMSMVYRYLLQSHDRSLTTLDEEIGFIRAYIQLLKTRFGEGLQVTLSQSLSKYADYYIPPLTIQLLVENAVKHNIVAASKPLQVNIFSDNKENLSVENNLQRKNSSVISHKKGLANIVAKYTYMKRPSVTIEESDHYFRVTVPLIKK
jgi:hypothetical protein